MSNVCVLHRSPTSATAAFAATFAAPSPALDFADGRRSKLWELSSHFHCSIVGTCLTAHELRQFLFKSGHDDAKSATDHDLHGRGVMAAGRRDDGGKALNKALDKRHDTAIRRFGKAKTSSELRALWKQSLEQGDIAGPYWALLTHPSTDDALAREVFGDVHMLSHQVGAAARLDISRLRRMEAELAERDDKIERQQARLAQAAEERVALFETIRRLEASLAIKDFAPVRAPETGESEALRRRLADESARSASLAQRLEASEEQCARAEAEAEAAKERSRALLAELAALEAALSPTGEEDTPAADGLRGQTLLYVGGRPKLVEQLNAFVAERGGRLLAHDGGVDDNLALLPGLVSQANGVFFPVDCVSHSAAEKVKASCRRLGKNWAPLRSASLACFARALEMRDAVAAE